jgi:uncharacterized protein (DUF1800 family)
MVAMQHPAPVQPTRRALVGGLAAAAAAGLAGCQRSDGAAVGPARDREVAVGEASAAPTVPTAPPGTTTTAAAPPLTTNRNLHLLRRLTYGPTPETLAAIETDGAAAFIEAQLAARTPQVVLDAHPLLASPFEPATSGNQAERRRLALELMHASLHRQATSPAQLYEQMVEFWTNHFSIHLFNGLLHLLKPFDDRDAIRPHALGRFRDLLGASAHSPAMLFSLDNNESAKGQINENYGRELLELHTVGVNAGYSEADVVATATVFTGWSGAVRTGSFAFRAPRHDDTPQRVMGWATPAGVTGEAQGESLLDYLATHPSTANFLARKLVVRFVSDQPDPGLVDSVAQAYLAADTDLAATLRALFNDERFYTTATPRFRRPTEYLVAALRALGGRVDGQTEGRRGQDQLRRLLAGLGQVPFDWPAPNGYPDQSGAWLNAGALVPRWNAAELLVTGAVPLATIGSAWRDGLPTGGDDLVDALSVRVLGEQPSPQTRSAVAAALPAAGDRATPAVLLLLCSPEFQYR